MRRPIWRSPLVLTTAGAIIAGLALVVIAATTNPAKNPVATSAPHSGPPLTAPAVLSPENLADGRAIGRSSAPATLTVWEDFQCPVCGRFTREIEPRLYVDFVQPGSLRIVYRDFVFIGQESLDAAAAARCAGNQGKFWPFHDFLFWNQGSENGGAFDRAHLDAIAAVVGLDGVVFDSCLNAGSAMALVKSETTAGEQAGIAETPTLVVDNQVMAGAPLSDLQYAALGNVIKASIAAHQSPSP